MRAAAVTGMVLLLAACGADPAPPSADTAPSSSTPALSPVGPAPSLPVGAPDVPGIAAEAVQLRTDEAVGGQVQVHIENTGTEAFTVTSVQLDSPGFALVPARELSTEYQPGRVINLPVQFGPVDCSTAADPVAARVTVVRPGGAVEELLLPLAGDTMARVHEEACAVQALLAVVDVAVESLAAEGETVAADVVLTRRSGNDPVVVSALLSSVVLEPVPGEELPLRLGPDEQQLRLPVTFDPERCDPHALAETKKPFVFPLLVTVGDGDDVPVDLPLDDAQKATLLEFLGRACR